MVFRETIHAQATAQQLKSLRDDLRLFRGSGTTLIAAQTTDGLDCSSRKPHTGGCTFWDEHLSHKLELLFTTGIDSLVAGQRNRGTTMGRYFLLWILGIPIPFLILLWLLGGFN